MKHKFIFTILLSALLLAGCSTGGPSNAEAKEVIDGVFFSDAKITEKTQCDLTPEMEEEGLSNPWLVKYELRYNDIS